MPWIIYIIWTGLILFFCIVVIPLADIGHSGGEQVPFTLFAFAVESAI